MFVDLRDRSGIVQLVFNERFNEQVFHEAGTIKPEYVIKAFGEVRRRENPNPNIPTGNYEVWVRQVSVLNDSKTPPISVIKDRELSEELRLRYRYIDLRREKMRDNIIKRHEIVSTVRDYLNMSGYIEIETPYLTKSTPEGARDFLVPSRLNRGKFYALPQSPQLFKQLLMISGFEKYYQIVRCFRDEDLRADRQPEFTQIDIEASFIEEEDIFQLIDSMFKRVLEECYNKTTTIPIKKMNYETALELYGSDKPDLRVNNRIENLDLFLNLDPKEFIREGMNKGKQWHGIFFPSSDTITRKLLDNYSSLAKNQDIGLFTWMRHISGSTTGPLPKLFQKEMSEVMHRLTKQESYLLLAAFGQKANVLLFLGKVLTEVARLLDLVDDKRLEFCWITDFPLFEWSAELNRIVSVHHPFTSPKADQIDRILADPLNIRSRSYDLILNGQELGGGSIRIHQTEVQEKVFKALGLSEEETKKKFGFFIDALEYGAPPHGGIALGLDRIVMMLQGESSIREVIAFPKTTSGSSPLTGAPDHVSEEQLKELGIVRRSDQKDG